MADRNALAELLMQDYGVEPSRALRNPFLELSRETYQPWPTLPPLPWAEARVYDPQASRPRDAMAPIAEAISDS